LAEERNRVIATLGKWEIRTKLSKHLRSAGIQICRVEGVPPEVPTIALDLEQAAADFIARHVLERDSVFFEG
jgi:hypothetical protein